MYFPIVHARTNELAALEEKAAEIRTSEAIFPVLIPFRSKAEATFNHVRRTVRRYVRSRQRFGLVVNPPQSFFPAEDRAMIREHLLGAELHEVETFRPVFAVTPDTAPAEVRAFLLEWRSQRVWLLHEAAPPGAGEIAALVAEAGNVELNLFQEALTGRGYRRRFAAVPAVLVEDPFVQRDKNADYPEDEYFSETYREFVEAGFVGFADYLTIGRRLKKGHAPHAIALHLSYLTAEGEIRVRHFVSDRKETANDPGGKFLEAARKLVAWSDANQGLVEYSTAIEPYREWLHAGEFHGLGVPKKLSVRHHLELMEMLLRRG